MTFSGKINKQPPSDFNLSFEDRFHLAILDNNSPNGLYHDEELKKLNQEMKTSYVLNKQTEKYFYNNPLGVKPTVNSGSVNTIKNQVPQPKTFGMNVILNTKQDQVVIDNQQESSSFSLNQNQKESIAITQNKKKGFQFKKSSTNTPSSFNKMMHQRLGQEQRPSIEHIEMEPLEVFDNESQENEVIAYSNETQDHQRWMTPKEDLLSESKQQAFKVKVENQEKQKSIDNSSKQKEMKYHELKNIPLGFVFDYFFAQFKDMSQDNLNFTCLFQNHVFKINGQKWYNETLKCGHSDSLELAKHLICLYDKVPLKELKNQNTYNEITKKAIQELGEVFKNYKSFLDEDNQRNEENKMHQVHDTSGKNDKKAFEQKYDWRKIYQDMNNIPVAEVAEMLGADANADGLRGKWKMHATGHNIQINGQLWRDFNEDVGSGGAINFMMHHLKMTQNLLIQGEEEEKKLKRVAVQKLMSLFGTDHKFEASDENFSQREMFYMPEIISQKLYKVVEYLHEKRGIPHWIIQKQIESEVLFAGFPSDWEKKPKLDENIDNDFVWAVFLSPAASAAEMRAVTRKDALAKLLAKGSDKELGGFTVKAEKEVNERIIVACEAAIDALSYHTLFPGRSAISCMGVNSNLASEIAQDTLSMSTKNGERYKFKLCFDNDLAGNEATISFVDKMIASIGEEEYQKEYDAGHIEYFELGIQALVASVRENETFYFEAMNTEKGKRSVDLFREAFKKKFGVEKEKKLLDEGRIKYINVAPNIYSINDENIDKEIENTIQLLSTKAPYYYFLKTKSDEKAHVKEKIQQFQEKLKNKLGVKYQDLITEGKIILQSPRIFKDWNECILYKMKNPKFIEFLEQNEERFKVEKKVAKSLK